MPRHCVLLLTLICISLTFGLAQNEIIVQRGDTLWGLAVRHNTTIQAILDANNLTGTDLFPGAILKLPSGSSPAGASAPPEAEAPAPQTYTVQPGDTLYDIAVAFSMTLDDLIAINNIDGTLIRPGQVLYLTALDPAAKPPPLVVTVKAGDTLWAIAREHNVSVDALISANTLGATLRPGDQLRIPGQYAGPNSDIGGAVTPVITVARGDTLWDIARRYNTSVSALMSTNQLTSSALTVGQQLRIIPGEEIIRAEPEPPRPTTPAPSSSTMVWPLTGLITSRFGYRLMRVGGSNFHAGLDIDGNTGDPIVAATAGTVTFSGWRGGFGNLVIVQQGDTEYFYAHCSQLLVSVGDQVVPGQVIAKVGATGNATGPHLHFEIRVNGTPVDPLPLLERYAGRP
jgi:murein DD-endopeptidase MepM/ murein hydrolase activator NlpD